MQLRLFKTNTGATPLRLSSRFSKTRRSLQRAVLDFAEAFLDCDCEDNLHSGYPERQFIEYLLELRAQGLGPDAIVDVMSDDYMVYAYPGDVLSFLDDSVRTFEAVETRRRRWARRRGRRRPTTRQRLL